ncbi:MAG: hypothetical protein VW840_17440, partial [Gammaproteobacteria bacterium]
ALSSIRVMATRADGTTVLPKHRHLDVFQVAGDSRDVAGNSNCMVEPNGSIRFVTGGRPDSKSTGNRKRRGSWQRHTRGHCGAFL